MADAKPEGPFTRILVATRGAPWSERALELGVRMAKAYQLELVVIAVLTPTYVPQKNAAWGIAAASEVGTDVRQFSQRVLEQVSTLAKANGLKCVCEMRQGRPAEDLILIGAHGEGGARRVTMGETGNEVVLKAPVPVIVVK
jgi:nucleotide-binding universal stress UspA family protein